jgi:hypothetical protein
MVAVCGRVSFFGADLTSLKTIRFLKKLHLLITIYLDSDQYWIRDVYTGSRIPDPVVPNSKWIFLWRGA